MDNSPRRNVFAGNDVLHFRLLHGGVNILLVPEEPGGSKLSGGQPVSRYILVIISEECVVGDLLVAPPSDDDQQAQDGGEDHRGQQQLQLGAAGNPFHVRTR